jgi:hypothetical protein
MADVGLKTAGSLVVTPNQVRYQSLLASQIAPVLPVTGTTY